MKLLVAKMEKTIKKYFWCGQQRRRRDHYRFSFGPSHSKFDYLLFLNSIRFEDFRLHKCDALRDLVPLYNLTNVKNTYGGMLLTVKLQATKSNTPPWVFFTFFKLYKWYQIAQSITNIQPTKSFLGFLH